MSDPNGLRARAVARIQRFLLQKGHPRLQMALILLATGSAGFLASVALHAAGLGAMWLRYPLAVAFAYLIFLGLLALWLLSFRSRRRHQSILPSEVYRVDTIDVSSGMQPWNVPPPGGAGTVTAAGAGDGPATAAGRSSGTSLGDGKGCLAVVVVILIVAAVAAAVLLCVWVLATAPVLLAEVLVDGLLLALVARRLGAAPPEHWTGAVLRRTLWVAVLVAVVFAVVGGALEALVPGAQTMGEAFPRTQKK
jgi:hypothetical protein